VRDLLHRGSFPHGGPIVFLDEGEREFIGEFACVTPRGPRRFLRRPHRRLKLQQVDFRRRAGLSVHLPPLPYALALAPTAESLPAPNFFAKTSFTQRLPPLMGRTIFGQVFVRGGVSNFQNPKLPPTGGSHLPHAHPSSFETPI